MSPSNKRQWIIRNKNIFFFLEKVKIYHMKNHPVNSQNNFIGGFYINTDLCDRIIEEFNTKISETIDLTDSVKGYKFMDLRSINSNLSSEYLSCLYDCVMEYMNLYNYSSPLYVGDWDLYEGVNLQYYPPGKNYSAIHTEKMNNNKDVCDFVNFLMYRHLTFITYLNDVSFGGHTKFYNYELEIRPEKGLTIIFPTQWTHIHSGMPTQDEKYIATGWFEFVRHNPLIDLKSYQKNNKNLTYE